jgi:hypothetical protein
MTKDLVILMDCWAYKDHETDLAEKDLRAPVMENINQFLRSGNRDVLSASYANMPLHKSLDNNLIDFHSTDFNFFQELFNKNNYENIWYLGLHWNRCIRSRELGYQCVNEFLQSINKRCKILTKQSCTLELKETKPGKQYSPTYEQTANFKDQSITMTKKIAPDTYIIQETNPVWNGKII